MADVTIRAVFEDSASAGIGGLLGTFSDLGNIVTGIKSAFDLAGQAIDAAVGFFKPFVDSAAGSETALTQLNTVFTSMNAASWITLNQLDSMSVSMMNLTGNSDEAEKAAEAMLLRYENLTGDTFPQALKITNDLSASLGVDLTSAARMVGMALDDPTAGMGRLNTQFRVFDTSQMEVIKNMAATGDVAGAQALIIQGLTDKFGGAADAIGNTFTGKLNIAKETLDNLKETIGGAFIPILDTLLDKFTQFANSPEVQNFVNALASAISTGDTTALTDSIKTLIGKIDWNGIAVSIDNQLAIAIASHDWSGIGKSFADALGKSFSNISIGDVKISSASLDALGKAFNQFFAGAIGDNFNIVVSYLSDIFASYRDRWASLGGELSQGMLAGFSGGITAWWDRATQFWRDYVQYVKDFLGIASPSTVFTQIGKDIVQGLINGWDSLIGSFISTALGDINKVLGLLGLSTNNLSASGLGSAGGGISATGLGSAGGGISASPSSLGGNVYNFYGPVYACQGADGNLQIFDCPSPNPFVSAMSGIVGGAGGGATGGGGGTLKR